MESAISRANAALVDVLERVTMIIPDHHERIMGAARIVNDRMRDAKNAAADLVAAERGPRP